MYFKNLDIFLECDKMFEIINKDQAFQVRSSKSGLPNKVWGVYDRPYNINC